MITKAFAMIFLSCATFLVQGQTFIQCFDGADTVAYSTLYIEMDTSASNIWQIGPSKKAIFDSAASQPYVLITDTINYYPPNDTSSFQITFDPNSLGFGVLAF